MGIATSTVATLSVLTPDLPMPPVITSQPGDQTVLQSKTAQFSVTATSTALISYQWYFNGTPLPSNANGSVLTLTNVQPSQAGQYQVSAGNAGGVVTSAVATLTVQIPVPPSIVTQPTNVSTGFGQNVQYAVIASGTAPMAYQWYFNSTNQLTNATASVLTLPNVQAPQAGTYLVVVANMAGSVTSTPALLQLPIMPNYTNQPPGLDPLKQNQNFLLSLPADNRTRTVLVSTDMVNWSTFCTLAPTNVTLTIPITPTNASFLLFRVSVTP
jgi:hypothetical protein